MAGENTLVCADPDQHTKELFLPFRCFCTRKDVSDYMYRIQFRFSNRKVIEIILHSIFH